MTTAVVTIKPDELASLTALAARAADAVSDHDLAFAHALLLELEARLGTVGDADHRP
jgi:hypothetical protein